MPVKRDCGLSGQCQPPGWERMAEKRLRSGCGGNGGLALEHDDTVRKVGGHDEVVLDDERSLLGMQDEPGQNYYELGRQMRELRQHTS